MIDDEPDDEDLTELLTGASDYSLAGHVVRNSSEAELTKLLADGWSMTRAYAEAVADFAMVLDRIPTEGIAKMTAKHLMEMTESIFRTIPKATPTTEEES